MKRGLTNEQIEWLKRVYAFTPNKEICEKLGRSLGNVHVWARKFGLYKSQSHLNEMARRTAYGSRNPKAFAKAGEPYRFKKGENGYTRLSPEKQEDFKMKVAKARKELLKAERRRVLFGLPQKTKLKLYPEPTEMKRAKLTLRRRGYLKSPNNNKVYCIMPDTRRNIDYEEVARKRGLTIYTLGEVYAKYFTEQFKF